MITGRSDPYDRVQRYMPSREISTWLDPNDAPLNKPWRCQARDSIGPYTLPFRCIKTESGWINARTKTPLHLTIVGWKY